MSDLPDAEELDEYNAASGRNITLVEFKSMWPVLSHRSPYEDWTLIDVVDAYRLGFQHGSLATQDASPTELP